MRFLTALMLLVITTGASAFTTITYQGQLQDTEGPVNDTVEMSFTLFDAETGGSQLDEPIDFSEVSVTNGLFQVGLDFGEQPYADGLWLAIEIEGQPLEPRQPVTGAPFAIDTAPDSPSEPPPDPQDCQDYCDAMMIGCSGEYSDTQQCLDTCSGFSGAGETGDTTGDTLACRATWHKKGVDGEVPVATACTNAAPDSPECVD